MPLPIFCRISRTLFKFGSCKGGMAKPIWRQTNIRVVTIGRADKLDDVNGREEDCFRSFNSCPGGHRTDADAGAGEEEGDQDYVARAFGLRNRLTWRDRYYNRPVPDQESRDADGTQGSCPL